MLAALRCDLIAPEGLVAVYERFPSYAAAVDRALGNCCSTVQLGARDLVICDGRCRVSRIQGYTTAVPDEKVGS